MDEHSFDHWLYAGIVALVALAVALSLYLIGLGVT
jgi:hypothetical protein